MHHLVSASIIAFFVLFALTQGKEIGIYMVLGLLIFVAIRGMRTALERNTFIKRWIPAGLTNTLLYILLVGCGIWVVQIIVAGMLGILSSFDIYQQNGTTLLQNAELWTGLHISEYIRNGIGSLNIEGMLFAIVNALSVGANGLLLVIIYTSLLFVDSHTFGKKIPLAFGNKVVAKRVLSMVQKIEVSLFTFLRIRFITALFVAGVGYLLLLALGIHAPLFWALLILIFRFIPAIGGILAIVFPTLFVLVQSGALVPTVVIGVGVIVTQIIVDSFIEPRMIDKNFNISPLVGFTSLTFWGLIWGPVGAMLSLPLTAIVLLILAQFPYTKPIAVLCSKNGDV